LHFSKANFDTEKIQLFNATPKQRGGSMKDLTVRQLEMTNRVVGFFQANPIEFRKGSPGAGLVAQFKKQVAEVQTLTATQASEFAHSRACSRARRAARESLKADVDRISRTAQAIAITSPGMEARFDTFRRVGDAKLETRARALADTARPYVKEFVDFEMEPGFVKTLESKIQAFAAAIGNHKASRTAHAATSQLIDDAMAHALTTLAQLDAIMENKLGGNTGLQLKWVNVRRIERRWISRKAEETTVKSPTPLVPAA
jgi:hypothetical protein